MITQYQGIPTARGVEASRRQEFTTLEVASLLHTFTRPRLSRSRLHSHPETVTIPRAEPMQGYYPVHQSFVLSVMNLKIAMGILLMVYKFILPLVSQFHMHIRIFKMAGSLLARMNTQVL